MCDLWVNDWPWLLREIFCPHRAVFGFSVLVLLCDVQFSSRRWTSFPDIRVGSTALCLSPHVYNWISLMGMLGVWL